MAMLSIKVTDSTGSCRVGVYYKEHLEKLCYQKGFVIIGVTAKSGGLAHRPELKLTSQAMSQVEDFNTLTEHML